ncbi:hypothetical protein Lesp02_01600 [Lentzea sp. NBRC 105346]|uniref:hypothetical protein n=1 Tax=Lentzea sp. NBRC 105346 TaxID=3032205 RepID=UPI0024A5AA3E|nr:hypothetical protein [Lentzea sp. NBRC 105346]GLZ27970.1 hypothetical protein Lesp02_01600 [Lentzea sp. NBRC 105346]
MRLGVLDIWSNSARLQIVDVRPGADTSVALPLRPLVRMAEQLDTAVTQLRSFSDQEVP